MGDSNCSKCGEEWKYKEHTCYQIRDSARERIVPKLEQKLPVFSVQDLEDLHQYLWELKHIKGDRYRNSFWTYDEVKMKTGGYEVKGWPIRLDYNQWHTILKSIEEHDLIAVMRNTPYGFNIKMAIHEHTTPIYPGVTIVGRHLLSISNMHLPHMHRPKFNDAWKIFSPITHEKDMAAKAVKNGFKVHDKNHYSY